MTAPTIRTLADIASLETVPLAERLAGYDSTYDVFRLGAERWPDATALTFLPGNSADEHALEISYRELFGQINRAANLFTSLGVGPGDVVSYLLPNLLQTHYVLWGGQTAGIVNAINPLLEAGQIAALLNEVGSKVLVTLGPSAGPELWAKVATLRDRVPSLRAVLQVAEPNPTEKAMSFEAGLQAQPADRLLGSRRIQPGDIAAYFHTGGTTCAPKIAQHTHGNELANACCAGLVAGLGRDDTVLCGLPLFHVNGVIVTGLAAFMAGARILLASPAGYRNKLVIEQFWRLVERYRVTAFSAVPTVYASLLAVPRHGADISSLRLGLCGAAPMPASLIRGFEAATGVRILEGYGLTEATCVSALNPRDGERRPGSIGLRLPYQEIKVVRLDEEGQYLRDCAPDEVGTLMIRGANVFPGYRQADANRGLWLEGGWLNTGDLARQDTDGYLWLAGRQKELIIRGGHNIDPGMIEEALACHPAVHLVAAVSKPDAYAGELPIAYVVLRPDHYASAEELLAHARANVPERAAVPAEIYIVPALPLTAVGKVFKPQLRFEAAARAYTEAIEKRLGDGAGFSVEVVPDARRGALAVIALDADEARCEALVREVEAALAAFSIAYEVRWNGERAS